MSLIIRLQYKPIYNKTFVHLGSSKILLLPKYAYYGDYNYTLIKLKSQNLNQYVN